MAVAALATLSGHTERVWHAVFSPDGSQLASTSADRTIRIWRAQEGGQWRCVGVLEGAHNRTVRRCAWNGDGRRLAVASFDGSVSVWGRVDSKWECVATLEGHENEVKSVAWHPTRPLLATASRDKSVWVWAAEGDDEFECLSVCHGHAQDVKVVEWHPTEALLLSGSYDDTIKVWQQEDDEWGCVDTLVGHSSTVWDVRFNAQGTHFISASDDLSVRVWERQGAKWLQSSVQANVHTRTVFSADWARGGGAPLAASGGADDAIHIYSLHNAATNVAPSSSLSRIASIARAHAGDINCVRWSTADPTLLASAGDDSIVRLWRVTV